MECTVDLKRKIDDESNEGPANDKILKVEEIQETGELENADHSSSIIEDKATCNDEEEKSAACADINTEEEYQYTKGDKFTSEIFKVELQGLPYRIGHGELKKKMKNLGLDPVKLKYPPRKSFAFVTFRNEEQRQKAITALDGLEWKKCTVSAKPCKPAADPYILRKKTTDGVPRKANSENLTVSERLANAVTPWVDIPYEEQVNKKEKEMHAYLYRLYNRIQQNNIFVVKLMKENKQKFNGHCCEVLPIIHSPVLNNYRNKCEFTIGISNEGTEKTVGFRLASYKSGSITVAEPEDCQHIPQAMKKCTKAFQDYLQTQSAYPAYDPEKKCGKWLMLTCRTTQIGDLMAGVNFLPEELSEEEVDEEIGKLKEYFANGPGKDLKLTSLFFQLCGDRGFNVTKRTCLLGNDVITEKLLGLSFRISPLAFFQVNTIAAEVLYSTVGNLVELNKDATLLDICCGTGTIGLTLAKQVKKVYGLELCSEAVEDAKVNASQNGIANAEFLCGKAEELLPGLITKINATDPIVAILDPPRGGAHIDVIRSIRKTTSIKSMVYVSCNPVGALINLTDLTRAKSKKFNGPHFVLKKAIPVDMFPHTPHCELVLYLERD